MLFAKSVHEILTELNSVQFEAVIVSEFKSCTVYRRYFDMTAFKPETIVTIKINTHSATYTKEDLSRTTLYSIDIMSFKEQKITKNIIPHT